MDFLVRYVIHFDRTKLILYQFNCILSTKQMVANFFASAVKFLNSPTITGKIDAS